MLLSCHLRTLEWIHTRYLPECQVWPNGWVFAYELSGSRFDSSCSHLNIWDADLPDIKLSRFHKEIRFLLCVIDIFSKYAWVIHLKDKKGIAITNAFQKILDESNRKPNKIWVDKGNKFYNRSMKSRFQKCYRNVFNT